MERAEKERERERERAERAESERREKERQRAETKREVESERERKEPGILRELVCVTPLSAPRDRNEITTYHQHSYQPISL